MLTPRNPLSQGIVIDKIPRSQGSRGSSKACMQPLNQFASICSYAEIALYRGVAGSANTIRMWVGYPEPVVNLASGVGAGAGAGSVAERQL